MALLKQLQILDEEDRTKAALASIVEKKDPALKELVVRLTAIRCRIQSSKCSHLVPFARREVRDRLFVDGRRLARLPDFRQVAAGEETGCH
jgi:hypothetical protein